MNPLFLVSETDDDGGEVVMRMIIMVVVVVFNDRGGSGYNGGCGYGVDNDNDSGSDIHCGVNDV